MSYEGFAGASMALQEKAYSEKLCVGPTLKQRLDKAVQDAETRLAVIQEAREIFERNPDIERLLDLMQRGSF